MNFFSTSEKICHSSKKKVESGVQLRDLEGLLAVNLIKTQNTV